MTRTQQVDTGRIEAVRKCLILIRTIADRGAATSNPEHMGYALQELSQVLLERTGEEERLFEPVPADLIPGIPALLEELQFVESSLESLVYSSCS